MFIGNVYFRAEGVVGGGGGAPTGYLKTLTYLKPKCIIFHTLFLT